jgi:hypothetical protein
MSGKTHLTEKQKDFILRNYNDMSDKRISKETGASRHAVHEFKQRILSGQEKAISDQKQKNPEQPAASSLKKNALLAGVLFFTAILIFAFLLRKNTFNLPHYRGDQHHYAALAYKLDTYGIKGYNLRGVDLYGSKQHPNLVQIAPAEDKGHVLKSLEAGNITYYDEPLHHIPFGFPMALRISHEIFASGTPYYLLAIPNDSQIIHQAGPGVGLRKFRFPDDVRGKQFYSVIVPLFFSLLMICLVFFTAKALYSNSAVGLIAMFLMTISPIDILTSQKLWSDDMTSALMLLAVLLYILSLKKNMLWLAFPGGIACGLSAITKQNGAFIAFVIIAWHFIVNFEDLLKKETFLKTVFNINLILFGLGILISAGYWFYKVYSVYGSPVYRPHQANIAETAKTGWFKMVGSRPKYLYSAGIPYQNPLFGLAYLSPLFYWIDQKFRKETLLLILWIIIFLFIFQVYLGGGGKEHRYMLPAYPAFAILGAYIADKIRVFLDKKIGFYTGTLILIICLGASAIWSVPMAMDVLFTNGALIMKPF